MEGVSHTEIHVWLQIKSSQMIAEPHRSTVSTRILQLPFLKRQAKTLVQTPVDTVFNLLLGNKVFAAIDL